MIRTLYGFIVAALLSGIAFCIAGFLYTKYVRPHLAVRGFLQFEDGLWERIKNRWDLFSAAAIVALATIWDTLLDLAVLAGDLVPALSGIDFTPLLLDERPVLSLTIKVMAAALPLVRAYIVAKRGG